MRSRLAVLAVTLLAWPAIALAGIPEHVVVVSVDGLRADLVDRTPTPNPDLMIRTGARARAARTVMPAVTLPAHASHRPECSRGRRS